MKLHLCDRCGQKYSKNYIKDRDGRVLTSLAMVNLKSTISVRMELCDHCMNEFLEWACADPTNKELDKKNFSIPEDLEKSNKEE